MTKPDVVKIKARKLRIIDLKRQLLHALINLNPEEMTKEEIEISYHLSKDPDMQKILQKHIKDKPKEV